jgi:transcriptional regulator with XRE-family HTH domain
MADSQVTVDKVKLRVRRVMAELDQSELATRAGIHQTHVSNLERGKRGTTTDTVEKLAAALGCTVGDLMPDQVAA